MFKTVSGTFRGGVVELGESPAGLPEGPVLVTFLKGEAGEPQAPNLSSEQVAELRGKLAPWEDDWHAPGMESYDRT